MGNFKNWLHAQEMAVQHHFHFADKIANDPQKRDSAGYRIMNRPGFRIGDRMLLIRDSQQVEEWLNAATEPEGLHWIIGYIEPEPQAKELDPDDWAHYHAGATAFGAHALEEFPKSQKGQMALPPPSPQNTIVYVKPTSRLHPLTPWQQVHNIGHAVWNFNQPQRKQFAAEIENAIRELQQSVYDKDPSSPPPSEAEVTVIMARLLDNIILQKALNIDAATLDDPKKIVDTAFNSYDELMYDMIASFLRNKGNIPLKPRGKGKLVGYDRTKDIPPNPALVSKKGVRDWAFKALAAGPEVWAEVSQKLRKIVLEALWNCVWAKQNGPIYPYRKLTTLP